MKKFILSLIALTAAFQTVSMPPALADENLETRTFILRDENMPTTLKLDTSTVRCLIGDYGASSLKISVPQLKYYTLFSHTTAGETEPCINAGFCGDTPMGADHPERVPETIIDMQNPMELVEINIQLKEILTIDHALKTCVRSLQERVHSTVRGMEFQHFAGGGIGTMKYETCLTLDR